MLRTEELLVEKEPGDSQNRRMVALVKDRIIVRHIPRELSSTFWHFFVMKVGLFAGGLHMITLDKELSHRDWWYCIALKQLGEKLMSWNH